MNDEKENISLNNSRLPTIYCHPRYYNIIAVNLLNSLSTEPDEKYLTAGFQQIFVPAPGACIALEPKCTFTTYLTYTRRISVISETSTPIESIIPYQFHTHLTSYDTSPLSISLYNIVSQISQSHL